VKALTGTHAMSIAAGDISSIVDHPVFAEA
jgi:hypothetical protein